MEKNTARERIRELWSTASRTERALRAIALAWMFGFVLLMLVDMPGLLSWGFTLWFPIPPLLLVLLVGLLILFAAVAKTTRRR
jgi:hypothetical protein